MTLYILMKTSWLALPPYGWSTTYLVDIFLFNKDSSHHGNFSSAWQLKSGMAKLALGAVSCAHSAHLEVMCTVHIVHVANRSSKSCKRYVTIFFLAGSFADDPEQRWIIIIWPRRAILTVRIMVSSLFLRYKTEKGLRAV